MWLVVPCAIDPPLPQCLGKYRVNLQSINMINALSSICVSPASRSFKLTNTSLSLLYRSPLLPLFRTHFYCSPPTSLSPPISPSSLLSDIVVGYERTLYSTKEDDVSLEICVIIYQPLLGGAPRTFTLTYNTTDYTAGIATITSSGKVLA